MSWAGIGGWDYSLLSTVMQDELVKRYNERYPEQDRKEIIAPPTNYRAPDHYDEHLDHFLNFFRVRSYRQTRRGRSHIRLQGRSALPGANEAIFRIRSSAGIP